MWLITLSCVTLQIYLIYCTDGYEARVIPKSCLDHLRSGSQTNGYYSIAVQNGASVTVYCDFTSEPGSAWTLVMSWSNENKNLAAFRSVSLTQNAPVNEKTPNWIAYRLPKDLMNSVKSQSSHWRATCSFDKVTFDYRDYMRGSVKDLDITTYIGNGVCKKVEFINIRGIVGYQVTTDFWQETNTWMLHTDSSYTGCHFNAAAGAVSSEDNFGHHANTNKKFRCTSDPSATTQYWFGGYRDK